MKNGTRKFKTTVLSMLGMISVIAVAILPTSVQADTWKTLPGSSCQANNSGSILPGQLKRFDEYIYHRDVTGGSAYTKLYCPIKMDDNAPATIGVYIDYTKAAGSLMSCYLWTDHWNGSEYRGEPVSIPVGSGTYVYKTITTGNWWSLQLECDLYSGDKLFAINYKAL